MKPILLAFWGLIAVLSLLWALADPAALSAASFLGLREGLLQLTGIIAVGAMSAAMILAARPTVLEPHLGGLDKMYRLHKWLGIAALVAAIAHWATASGPRWLVGLGWLTLPPRRAGGPPPAEATQSLLAQLRGPAEAVGEWAFYAAVVLIALALIKRLPYRAFFLTHRLMAVVYLVLAFHTVVLLKAGYWLQPIGVVMAILLAGGIVAAALSLLRRIGAGRKVKGTIESLFYVPDLRVLVTTIRLDEGWRGHDPGQFAFVTSHRGEGAHPFTIASAWDKDGEIVFVTKALGDYTATMHERLKAGDRVTVEGPYGGFDFRDDRPRQIWVGAGIGITPFIARMKHLARGHGGQAIDFFHTTADYDEGAINQVTADAKAAGIRLHVLVDAKDGLLDADRIRAAVPDWKSASVWFCGPPGFGRSLRRSFLASGLKPGDFHQELFELR